MDIVLAEEIAAGWTPRVLGAAAMQKQHGCDVLSTPPGGGVAHPVEVKGWGEPFLTSRQQFSYHQDIRASQMLAAQRDPNYRIEMVANLTAYLAGTGPYERLTLTASELIERAVPRLFDVPLTGKRTTPSSRSSATRPSATSRSTWPSTSDSVR